MNSKLPDRTNSTQEKGSGGTGDVAFKRIVTASTALGFATVLGAAACLERSAGRSFEFRWHWRAVIAMGIGVAAAIQLWQLLWRAEAENTKAARSKLARFCVVLLVGTAGVFVYPITFVSSEHMKDVLFGLSLAVVVLTFVGWMIYRVFTGFTENDEENKLADDKGV